MLTSTQISKTLGALNRPLFSQALSRAGQHGLLVFAALLLNVSAQATPTSKTGSDQALSIKSHAMVDRGQSVMADDVASRGTVSDYQLRVRNIYNAHGFMSEVVESSNDNRSLWLAHQADTLGNVTNASLGNGVTEHRHYDRASGVVTEIFTDSGHQIQDQAYAWDSLGNLSARADYLADDGHGVAEAFTYDRGYRLQRTAYHANFNGGISEISTHDADQEESYAYYANGNTFRNGATGAYQYNNGRPHAVSSTFTFTQGLRSYEYDANGNLEVATGGETPYEVTWTNFNKPARIQGRANNESVFHYGADRARYRHTQRIDNNGDSESLKTVTYIGSLYEKHDSGSDGVEHHHYIRAAGRTIAVKKISGGHLIGDLNSDNVVNAVDLGLFKRSFFGSAGQSTYNRNADFNDDGVINAQDLGIFRASFFSSGASAPIQTTEYWHRDHLDSITAISDDNGHAVVKRSYSPWGKARDSAESISPLPGVFLSVSQTDRGYTGHEMLNHLGLIHMNGRIYDPEIGRFLSPDIFVQFPESAQNYNRYTYVNNNPLSYNDPSGHFIQLVFVVANILYAAVEGYQNGGFSGMINGAVLAVGSAAVGAFIGGTDLGLIGKAVAHGVSQGAFSKMGGGRFSDGFLSGSVSKILSPITEKIGGTYGDGNAFNIAKRAVISGIIGGTASEVGGGKFANGAMTAALVSVVNGDGETLFHWDKPLFEFGTSAKSETKITVGTPAANVSYSESAAVGANVESNDGQGELKTNVSREVAATYGPAAVTFDPDTGSGDTELKIGPVTLKSNIFHVMLDHVTGADETLPISLGASLTTDITPKGIEGANSNPATKVSQTTSVQINGPSISNPPIRYQGRGLENARRAWRSKYGNYTANSGRR